MQQEQIRAGESEAGTGAGMASLGGAQQESSDRPDGGGGGIAGCGSIESPAKHHTVLLGKSRCGKGEMRHERWQVARVRPGSKWWVWGGRGGGVQQGQAWEKQQMEAQAGWQLMRA